MKKMTLIYLIFWFIVLSASGRTDKKNFRDFEKKYPTVFLDMEYFEPIELKTPESKVKLKNDTTVIDGQFYLFTLLQKKDGMYDVIVWDALFETYIGEGKISDDVPLCIFSKQYMPAEFPNKFYNNPSYDSEYISDTTYIVEQMKVLDCHGRWLKVEYEGENGKTTGWYPPEMQCSSVYTTCS